MRKELRGHIEVLQKTTITMADPTEKHPLNVSGKFYNDLSCVDCGLCPEMAPKHFRRDDEGGYSFLFEQPITVEEEEAVREAMACCPTESIGDDGLCADEKADTSS